jgi:Aspartyl/Asparaginyl beta-hydroxylase
MQLTDDELIAHFQRAFALPDTHPELAVFRRDIATRGAYYWIVFRGGLPFLELDLEVPDTLLPEASAVQDAFVPHRDGEYAHHGWRAACIHGLSPAHTQGARAYGHPSDLAAPYRWCEEVSARTPRTVAWVRTWFGDAELFRIRYMLLEPNGFVAPHTDWKLPSMIGLNVALNMPAGCRFMLDSVGALPMRAGKAYLLDLSHVHSVINEGSEPRFHMILHGLFGRSTPFRERVERSYRASTGP